MQDCKKPVKKYGKQSKKRMKKMQSDNRIYYRMLNCIVLSALLILLIITCLLLHNKRQRELEEKQAIQQLIEEVELTEAEHQVDTVQEPIPDVIEPMPDEYYDALELLAHLIYAEVGNESEDSMWYAGSVVINRINHHEYPNNLYDVVYQRGQYEVTWNGGLYKETPSDIAYEVAAELLNSGSVLPEDVLYQAEFVQGSGVYEKIDNTYYCYE